MAKPGRTGLARIWYALGYSWRGFRAAWRHEAAFRQESLAALLLAPLSYSIAESPLELLLLLAVLLLVLVVELLNSAIEAVVDRIGDAPHSLSARAKDMGSAAVFVALVLAGLVWGVLSLRLLL